MKEVFKMLDVCLTVVKMADGEHDKLVMALNAKEVTWSQVNDLIVHNRLECHEMDNDTQDAFCRRALFNIFCLAYDDLGLKKYQNAVVTTVLSEKKRAVLLGYSIYGGKTCPHGHDGSRYTNSGACVGCEKARQKVDNDTCI